MIETNHLPITFETARAVQVNLGGRLEWMPKSQIRVSPNRVFVVAVKEWIVREKGITPKQTEYRNPPPSAMPYLREPLTKGIYELSDGTIYQVKIGKISKKAYASKWTPINGTRLTEKGEVVNYEFVYAPGDVDRIKASDRISLARAEELSLRFESCIACGRGLKVAESVKRGVGPVCAKKKNYWA